MRLVLATEAQKRARDLVTFSTWGGGLTQAQFLTRELELRAHPWAARTMSTWLWCADDETVLASCESFVDAASVGARAGTAAVIASVFTEPQLRGKGHAAAMLRAVLERLSSCLAVTLFSEIGAGLYQRLGFWSVPAFDTWFDAAAETPAVEWLEGALPPPVHPAGDDATLRLGLAADRLDWQLCRERFYARALGRTPLEVHGARVGASTITWTAYWKTNELHVLSLDARDEAALPLLISAARNAAHRAGLPLVRVWETRSLAHLPGARRLPRTDELAMFCPLVPGVQAWTQVERGLWA
ncbi:MAG: GNAT family N-acetyltransferase [Myxococcota bacterium]